ncbi:MAG TPA: hypothetical protein VEU28_04685 [Actinomycetota bacterium]|nr:hypothetical protein [Actinomycetota bacterium]
MFTEWPGIEPEQDNPLLQAAERKLVEFLRSSYVLDPTNPQIDPKIGPPSLICSN